SIRHPCWLASDGGGWGSRAGRDYSHGLFAVPNPAPVAESFNLTHYRCFHNSFIFARNLREMAQIPARPGVKTPPGCKAAARGDTWTTHRSSATPNAANAG